MMNDTFKVWGSRLTIGILAFMSTWLFTTVLELKEGQIKLEQKYNDDKTQWALIQQLYDQQTEHEVKLRFHHILLEDLRKNPNKEHSKDVEKLIKKLGDSKDKKSVDEFKDYHQEQRQEIKRNE